MIFYNASPVADMPPLNRSLQDFEVDGMLPYASSLQWGKWHRLEQDEVNV